MTVCWPGIWRVWWTIWRTMHCVFDLCWTWVRWVRWWWWWCHIYTELTAVNHSTLAFTVCEMSCLSASATFCCCQCYCWRHRWQLCLIPDKTDANMILKQLPPWRTGGNHWMKTWMKTIQKAWSPVSSSWMKQVTWLRIVHSGDWCLRVAPRSPSGAWQYWMMMTVCHSF